MKIRYIETNFGKLNRDDKKDWITYYNMYMGGEILSLPDLAEYLGISIKRLRTILNNHNLKPISISETSKRCSIKNKQTCLKKYGVETTLKLDKNIKKSKKVKEIKYGNSCVFANKEIINKRDSKNIKKYGNKCTLHSDKGRDVMLEKHGVPHPMQSNKIKNKIKKTNLERYGVENVFQGEKIINTNKNKEHLKTIEYWTLNYLNPNNYTLLDDFKGVILRDSENNYLGYNKYSFKHETCKTVFKGYFHVENMIRCPKCFPFKFGELENKIFEYIKNFIPDTEQGRFDLIPPRQIDIFIPELNIGFEYNGSIWHSSKFKNDKNYHGKKTDLALRKGIKLYHIWEHDNEEIIKSMICGVLNKIKNKIYARKCEIKEVKIKKRKEFFDENHLHGDVNSKFSLGLYFENELISCVSFRKHGEGIEIARFATKLNTLCVGGFSKLLKYSIIKCKQLGYNKIITYCDRDWTPDYENSVYYKNGFEFVGDSGCILKYYDVKNSLMFSRETFQKHKLKKLFPKSYSDDKTADEILNENKIYSCHNSGNWKFEFNIT